MKFERREMFMNKIQALANEMKQFFSPQTVTNGTWRLLQAIVNTLYGNPLRRAWIELNYIYFYIIREIEKMSFKLFVTEAEWFLSKEEDIRQQMSGVNLCSLRLSDMGNTTLGVTAPPYDEIAQEAFSVWELFEGKYR